MHSDTDHELHRDLTQTVTLCRCSVQGLLHARIVNLLLEMSATYTRILDIEYPYQPSDALAAASHTPTAETVQSSVAHSTGSRPTAQEAHRPCTHLSQQSSQPSCCCRLRQEFIGPILSAIPGVITSAITSASLISLIIGTCKGNCTTASCRCNSQLLVTATADALYVGKLDYFWFSRSSLQPSHCQQPTTISQTH